MLAFRQISWKRYICFRKGICRADKMKLTYPPERTFSGIFHNFFTVIQQISRDVKFYALYKHGSGVNGLAFFLVFSKYRTEQFIWGTCQAQALVLRENVPRIFLPPAPYRCAYQYLLKPKLALSYLVFHNSRFSICCCKHSIL